MAFDIGSATQGAQVGSAAGPYGAAAGFVIGGFIGGSQKKRRKKAAQRDKRKLTALASPQHLADVARSYTPLARENVLASGAGNAIQQDVQSNITNRGLTGSGVGLAFQNAAAQAPSNLATQISHSLAQEAVQREIDAFLGTSSYLGQPGSVSGTSTKDAASQLATTFAIFKGLGSKTNKAASPGGNTFEGQFPRGGEFPSGVATPGRKSLFPALRVGGSY